MSAMDLLVSDSGATGYPGASLSMATEKVCNNLQNVVAITYIFALQQPTFLVCNFLHFYFTTNRLARSGGDSKARPDGARC